MKKAHEVTVDIPCCRTPMQTAIAIMKLAKDADGVGCSIHPTHHLRITIRVELVEDSKP